MRPGPSLVRSRSPLWKFRKGLATCHRLCVKRLLARTSTFHFTGDEYREGLLRLRSVEAACWNNVNFLARLFGWRVTCQRWSQPSGREAWVVCSIIYGALVFAVLGGMRVVINIRKMGSVRPSTDTKTVHIHRNKRNRPVRSVVGDGNAVGNRNPRV